MGSHNPPPLWSPTSSLALIPFSNRRGDLTFSSFSTLVIELLFHHFLILLIKEHPTFALLQTSAHLILQVVYFVNSGTEANELAMLMARLYSGNLGMIALRNAYHGGSSNTIGLTALNTWKYPIPQVSPRV